MTILKQSLLGTENARDLLLCAGIAAFQRQAGYLVPVTSEKLPETLEEAWQASEYSRKEYPVRFIGKVSMAWLTNLYGSIPPNEVPTIRLDERLYRLLGLENEE